MIVTEKVKELYMKDALDELRSMDNIFENQQCHKRILTEGYRWRDAVSP